MTVTTEITIDFTDLDSMAEAIGLGITTPEQLAQHIGCELDDGVLVLEDCPMYADDGNAEIEYDSDTTAKDAAEDYVSSGDWGDTQKTDWVTVYTYRKGVSDRGEVMQINRERHKIELSPSEPDCIDDDEHVWKSPFAILGGCRENPGVWGHGGGVFCKEVCMICGCSRTTDTWAQDMSDGEQGLTSTEYEEGEYSDEVNKKNLKLAKETLDTETEQSGEFQFEWTDDDGDVVGLDEDGLIEFGQQLRRNEDATKPTGTKISGV